MPLGSFHLIVMRFWYSSFHDRIGDFLETLAPQWWTVGAKLYDHVATAADMSRMPSSNPLLRLGWRRIEPAPIGKVACRYREDMVIEQGNHSAGYIGGVTQHPEPIVIRHYPYRSAEQFVKKVRNGSEAYRATDTTR